MRLWDTVVSWLEFPDLYEMQKLKSVQDQGRIANTFRPYLEARDWISINRGKVINFDGSPKDT